MELLLELLKITKSQIKALEILDVINKNKPVARQLYKDENPIKKFCKKNKLSIVISPIKIRLLDSEKPFSNKGYVTHRDTNDTLKLVYIASSENLALNASLAELKENDQKLGELLGYPKCCVKFFLKHKQNRKEDDFNYEKIILNNIKDKKNKFYFGLNIFKREKDACLLSHFPCSLECSKSKIIAKKRFEMLMEYNKKFALGLKKELIGNINKYKEEIEFK